MHKYIRVSLTSTNSVSHEQRKAYLRSLYGNHEERRKGEIYKFCGSIGFKPIMNDPYSEFPILIHPKLPSPNSYVSPETMLYDALNVNLTNNGIVDLTIPVGIEEHDVAKYSYNREDIAKKFTKFLEKIYPDVIVSVALLDDLKLSVKNFVLDFFYKNMDFDEDVYTVELSSHRLLTNEEIEEIYKKMADTAKYDWRIEQFYCETCKKHNPDAPYHIMVAYDSDNN